MDLIPYQTEHLAQIEDFGCQAYLKPYADTIATARYEDLGPAFTVVIDERIIGAAGLVEMTQYRAAAWALFSPTELAQQFLSIHRATLRFLCEQKYRRIDAHVAIHDTYGHRWARMLGFEVEVYCRPWALPNGDSVAEYVRWG